MSGHSEGALFGLTGPEFSLLSTCRLRSIGLMTSFIEPETEQRQQECTDKQNHN